MAGAAWTQPCSKGADEHRVVDVVCLASLGRKAGPATVTASDGGSSANCSQDHSAKRMSA